MRKIIITIILLCSTILSYSQYGVGDKEIMESWKGKTLVVMLYPNSENYNEAVKSIAKDRWYNDKIEYVNYKDKKELSKRKDIVVLSVKQWFDFSIPVICFTTKMNGAFEYTFSYKNDGCAHLYVQSQHEVDWANWRKKVFSKIKPKVIESSVIAQGLEILKNSSQERIELLVKMLFNTSDKFKEGEYVYKKARVDNARYCTKENSDIVKSKTLLLEEKSIPRSAKNKKLLKIEHLQSIYKGKIKIVSEDELKEAIKNKEGLYLHSKEEGSFTAFSVIDLEKLEIIYAGRGIRSTNDENKFEVMLEELSSSIF